MSSFSPLETLLTSEETGQMWNLAMWDYNTGSAITHYKGSSTSPNTLCLLSDSFLISSRPGKPILNVWSVDKHEQQPNKITTPGPLISLCSSPSGHHLVGSTASEDGGRVYVWQTSNGVLHRVIDEHYQPVTCMGFTADGSKFVTAGKDCNVMVWDMLEVVTKRRIPGQTAERAGKPRPLRTWSDHKLAVNSIHICGNSRVFTASHDQTCKVYCIPSGNLLLDVSFAAPLTSVCVDNAETSVFIGTSEGRIHVFSLLSPPRNLKANIEADEDTTFAEKHAGSISCLALSMDGSTLASGSDDRDVRLWETANRNCVRTIGHKGKVTSVRFIRPPRTDCFKPSMVLSPLQRSVATASTEDTELEIIVRRRKEPCRTLDDWCDETGVGEDSGKLDAVDSEEVSRLKKANLELYRIAARSVLKGQSD